MSRLYTLNWWLEILANDISEFQDISWNMTILADKIVSIIEIAWKLWNCDSNWGRYTWTSFNTITFPNGVSICNHVHYYQFWYFDNFRDLMAIDVVMIVWNEILVFFCYNWCLFYNDCVKFHKIVIVFCKIQCDISNTWTLFDKSLFLQILFCRFAFASFANDSVEL